MGPVLITGCSSGIGLASAVLFAQEGETVFAGVRNPATASLLNAAIATGSLDITVVALDVCDQASVDAAVARVEREAGSIDVLVNNAGICQYSAVEDQPVDDARLTLETNLLGPLRLIRAVIPGMRSRGQGTIVNVSSVSGFVPVPFLGIYSASKAGLESMSEVLAHEVQGAGIRVVIIEPGVFDTAIDAKAPPSPPSAAMPGQAEASAQMRLDMAAQGPPTELAARVIHDAITADESPLRVPVGEDAVMMTDLWTSQTGPEFFAALHSFYGLP